MKQGQNEYNALPYAGKADILWREGINTTKRFEDNYNITKHLQYKI